MATVKPANEHKHCNQLMDICTVTIGTLPHRKQLSSVLSCSLVTKAAISFLTLIVVHHISEEMHVLNPLNLTKAPTS